MKYLQIPDVPRPVSNLAIGSMVCSTKDLPRTFALLDRYVACGGTLLDTGHVYAGGESERAIGEWIRARGNREDVLILDKGCHPYGDSGPRVNPEDMRTDLSESLQRLGLDYIDIYLLHRDDENVPVGPLVEALNEEVERGSIRAYGGSNWRPGRLQAANEYAAAHGLRPFVASSPNLSLARANEPMWAGCAYTDDADRAWYEHQQMPLIAWSSQAGGFFTGRFSPEDTSNEDMVRVYYSEENFERLRRAREVATRRGVHALHIALAWVLNQRFPTVAIIGPQTVEELESSVQAAELELTADEVEYLNGVYSGAQKKRTSTQPLTRGQV